MIVLKYLLRILMMLNMAIFANKSYSVDIVKLQNQQMSVNKAAHNIEVIQRALEITEDEYGPFKLEVVTITMSRDRLHKSIIEGKICNAVIVLSNALWDDTTIGIKVPVRLGLLSYRLLLVNKEELPEFKKINDLQDLKRYYAGLASGWQTAEVFKYHGLNMTLTGHFDGIFSMLEKKRFDYIPRGIYEVYDELNSRPLIAESLAVEPNLALNIPTISRLYVSQKEPRISKRLDIGLHKLLANGELKQLLYKYYGRDIEKAKLKARQVIKIENPYYDMQDSLSYEYILFGI